MDSDRDTLSRHRYGTTFHLHGNADAKDCAAGKLYQGVHSELVGEEPPCQEHVQVNEHTEEKSDNQLEQLNPLKVPS